jgi:hypothetical protein
MRKHLIACWQLGAGRCSRQVTGGQAQLRRGT